MPAETEKSQADGGWTDALPAHLRSALTNRSTLFLDGDGRGKHARLFRDLLAGVVSDLGGAENVTTAELALARQACALSVFSETYIARIGRGELVESGQLVPVINGTVRVFSALGLRRRPRPVQSPAEYLQARKGSGS